MAEFLKEFDDEEEVLEKLLEAKVNGTRDCYGYASEHDAERGGGGMLWSTVGRRNEENIGRYINIIQGSSRNRKWGNSG